MGENSSPLINAQRMYLLRQWERKNLPYCGKEVGYQLFLELANTGGASTDMMKEFYLSMPYAESTLRLLFRNLESDGWIEMPRKDQDKRVRGFVLTDKFLKKQEEWLETIKLILASNERIEDDYSNDI